MNNNQTTNKAASELAEVIKRAKTLGVTEIGHQINPEQITARELAATEQLLSDAIRDYSMTYLGLHLSQEVEASRADLGLALLGEAHV